MNRSPRQWFICARVFCLVHPALKALCLFDVKLLKFLVAGDLPS